MLVLSRQLNGIIWIGDCIVVTVVGVAGNTVRLKTSAPLDVSIRRGELSGSPQLDAGSADEDVGEDSGGLVLSRKRGETIVINGDIVITVLKIQGRNVRLGIEAPSDVAVHRKEVRTKINAGG